MSSTDTQADAKAEHDCFKRFNQALEPRNGRLAMAFGVTDGLGLVMRLLVATEKVDKAKRKPVPHVVASFCPFCGIDLNKKP